MLCVLPGRLITSKLLSLPHSLLYNWRSHRHPPASLEQKEKKKRASIRSPNKPATPKKKTATLPEEQQQPPKQNKIKQTKSSNSNEIPTRESKTVSNKLQLQTQKHNPRKNAIQMFSSGHKRMAKRQRESRETDGDKERAERRRARQRAREPGEMREHERESERECEGAWESERGARVHNWLSWERPNYKQPGIEKGNDPEQLLLCSPPSVPSLLVICVAQLTRGSVQSDASLPHRSTFVMMP